MLLLCLVYVMFESETLKIDYQGKIRAMELEKLV